MNTQTIQSQQLADEEMGTLRKKGCVKTTNLKFNYCKYLVIIFISHHKVLIK